VLILVACKELLALPYSEYNFTFTVTIVIAIVITLSHSASEYVCVNHLSITVTKTYLR
jgi:hypothetical protein